MNYLPGSVVPFSLDENTYRNLRLLVAKTVRENIRPSHYYYQIVTDVRVSYGFLNVSGRFPFNLCRSLTVGSKYYSETAHRFLSTNREKARRQRIIVHSGLVSFAACMALGGARSSRHFLTYHVCPTVRANRIRRTRLERPAGYFAEHGYVFVTRRGLCAHGVSNATLSAEKTFRLLSAFYYARI